MHDNMSVFFFFSSRRRHTRYWRDWSSDVCSSDLDEFGGDVTAGTANLDVTVDFGSARVKPYVGAGIGLGYIDTDFGNETETLGNLIGGVQFDLDFLKPYGQVKYTRSVENSDDNSATWAF